MANDEIIQLVSPKRVHQTVNTASRPADESDGPAFTGFRRPRRSADNGGVGFRLSRWGGAAHRSIGLFDGCVRLIGFGVVALAAITGSAGRARGMVLISEILADPPNGSAGDANRDGVRSSSWDEFVELFNLGEEQVNLKGWSLWDGAAQRHVFGADFFLGRGQAVTIFGRTHPRSVNDHMWVSSSSGGLSLNNSGDTVSLFDAGGRVADRHAYGPEGGRDVSLARDFREVSFPWVLHTDLSDGQPFSAASVPFGGEAIAAIASASVNDPGPGFAAQDSPPPAVAALPTAAVPEPWGLGWLALGVALSRSLGCGFHRRRFRRTSSRSKTSLVQPTSDKGSLK